MTLLEYLRMRIPDKDTDNKIFEDTELEQVIKLHSKVRLIYPEQVDYEGKVFNLDAVMLDETYTAKVWVDNQELTTGWTLDYETGVLTFDEAQEDKTILVQVKAVDWNSVLADCYEMIMGDYRKLNSYSIQNANLSYDDTKKHLRYLANYYRPPEGWELL